MLDLPDLDVPRLDDATLHAFYGRALDRSADLHADRLRRRAHAGSVAGSVAGVALLVVGLVIAFPGGRARPQVERHTTPGRGHGSGTGPAPHGGHGGPAPHGGHGGPAPHGGHGGPVRWRLVGDVATVGSWQVVTATGYQPSVDLDCPAAGTCYADAIGGGLEFTHDGGSTWQQAGGVGTSSTADDLSCVDADHCALLAEAAGGGTFFTTADGGASWTSQPGPSQISSSALVSVLSCATPSSCVVVAFDGDSPLGSVADVVLATSDGGATWAEPATLGSRFLPTRLTCDGAGTCVVVGMDLDSASSSSPGKFAAAYASADGGATWSPATVPAGAGVITSLTCPTPGDCVGTSYGVDGGATGLLLATADGGDTWAVTSASGLPGSPLSSISCPSVASCWLSGTVAAAGGGDPVPVGKGQGMLAWSADGGATWQQVAVPTGVGPVTDVTCPDTTTCYALGFETSSSGSGQAVLLTTGGS